MTGAYTKWRRITWNKSKRINFIVKLQNYYVFLVNRLDSRQLSWYYWVSVYHLLSLLFFSILPIFCRYFFISIIRLLLAVTISRAQCFVHRLVSMSFMHVWCCTIHCDHSAHHLWIKLVIFAFSRLSNLLAFGSITQMSKMLQQHILCRNQYHRWNSNAKFFSEWNSDVTRRIDVRYSFDSYY